jgi:hypothetical protein
VKIIRLLNNTTTNPTNQEKYPNVSISIDKYNQDLPEKLDKFTQLYQNPQNIDVGSTEHEIIKVGSGIFYFKDLTFILLTGNLPL